MQNRPGSKAGSRGGKNPLARQVRIIGGRWKRTPLPVLKVDGLRPTPDRVRETLFNWLSHLLNNDWDDAACLDLFAGTGALGFEAASRGAAKVMMVEGHPAAVRQLEATKTKLQASQVSIVRGDAGTAVQRLSARFRVIFLDPPYHQDWLPRMLPLCERLLADDGLIYVESEFPMASDAPAPDWLAPWRVVRANKAGMVFYHVLQRNTPPQIEA